MRGKVHVDLFGRLCRGITPAYAGKSFARYLVLWTPRDHPRVCGEKAVLLIRSCHSLGSPPRMRGKVFCGNSVISVYGITPAYAGKRFLFAASAPPHRDHPRVCGEKPPSRSLPAGAQGSPPRMRGKGIAAGAVCTYPGITPAHAGKSSRRCSSRRCCRDHPRACGEKNWSVGVSDYLKGSPPRMRGKVREIKTGKSRRGITPAHAGKSAGGRS